VFIRFVISRLDTDSGRRQGLFQAADELRKSGELNAHEDRNLRAIFIWFNENLEKPARLTISSRPHAKEQAISWFKSSAVKHIRKMREFQRVLESHGILVEEIRTSRPGYIVYEDEFQVAAYPFRDTAT
jgi:hypothetical protein